METFVGDTPILHVSTGIDLSGYSALYIKYRKPNGATGLWGASLDPNDNTYMNVQLTTADLDQSGEWGLQAHADGAGASLHGKPVILLVKPHLPG